MRKFHLGLALASALALWTVELSAAHANQGPADKAEQSAASRASRPDFFTLMGKTYCFGVVPGVKCDLTLPATRQARHQPDDIVSRWVRELRARLATDDKSTASQ